jgi:hypothetical protein
MDTEEKERIVAMIGDLDEEHLGKIYEIIEKYQPKLLMGSTECDIDVRLLIRRLHHAMCCFSLSHTRTPFLTFAQLKSLEDSTLIKLRKLCESVVRFETVLRNLAGSDPLSLVQVRMRLPARASHLFD